MNVDDVREAERLAQELAGEFDYLRRYQSPQGLLWVEERAAALMAQLRLLRAQFDGEVDP